MTDNYNLGDEGDNLYREMLALYDGKNDDEARALSARLILTMMNQIGDAATLREIFKVSSISD